MVWSGQAGTHKFCQQVRLTAMLHPPLQQCVKRLQWAWLCGAMCLCDGSISQIRVAIRHHQRSLSSFTKVRSAHAEGTQLYEHFSGCPVSVYRRQSILFVLHSLLPACVSMLFCVCFMFLQTLTKAQPLSHPGWWINKTELWRQIRRHWFKTQHSPFLTSCSQYRRAICQRRGWALVPGESSCVLWIRESHIHYKRNECGFHNRRRSCDNQAARGLLKLKMLSHTRVSVEIEWSDHVAHCTVIKKIL